MNPSFIKFLNDHRKVQFFERGETVYTEDSPVMGLLYLNRGLIKHYKVSPHGQQYIFHLSRRGDLLEIEALLSGNNYFTAAKAIRSSIIQFIPLEIIQCVLKKDPIFCQSTLKILADNIRKSNIERVELAMGDVRERLAHLLAFLAQEYGEEEESSIKINVDISISEMAEMIGTVPETASRHLKQFRDESLIMNQRSRIKILDLHSLQNLNRLL